LAPQRNLPRATLQRIPEARPASVEKRGYRDPAAADTRSAFCWSAAATSSGARPLQSSDAMLLPQGGDFSACQLHQEGLARLCRSGRSASNEIQGCGLINDAARLSIVFQTSCQTSLRFGHKAISILSVSTARMTNVVVHHRSRTPSDQRQQSTTRLYWTSLQSNAPVQPHPRLLRGPRPPHPTESYGESRRKNEALCGLHPEDRQRGRVQSI